jgi:O-antigen ligase/polysaccharide polymerase Wzy-like membrane protein
MSKIGGFKSVSNQAPPYTTAILSRGPGLLLCVLFFAVLSGPPRFRVREAEASLYGEIDFVILLTLAVWSLAGLWVAWQLLQTDRSAKLKLLAHEKVGIVLVAFLSIAVLRSPAPLLVTFKLLQLSTMILFTSFFVQLYGVRTTLKQLFLGHTILCLAIVVTAFVAPDLVFVEQFWGGVRLEGDLIAQTADVSVLAIILMLTADLHLPRKFVVLLLPLFVTLLLLSRSRSGFVCLLILILLALVWPPRSAALHRFSRYSIAAVIAGFLIGGYRAVLWVIRDDPSTLWTVSDRVGLWAYLLVTTLNQAPWTGLGYYAASRQYAREYNPDLGTAHSVVMEVLVGGGVLSVIVFLVLIGIVSLHMFKLVRTRHVIPFGIVTVFIVSVLILSIGGDLGYGPVGFTFWCVAAMASRLQRQPLASHLPARNPGIARSRGGLLGDEVAS